MADESVESSAYKRAENWNKADIARLVEGVNLHLNVIKGKFTPQLTKSQKNEAWDDILERINSQSATKRTVEQIKKKWIKLQSDVKRAESKRLNERNATGGGPAPPDLESIEAAILETIPKASVSGIEGGVDSSVPKEKEEKGKHDHQKKGKKRKSVENETEYDVRKRLVEIEQERLEMERETLRMRREHYATVESHLGNICEILRINLLKNALDETLEHNEQ